MSLVNEYRNSVRDRLGLEISEEPVDGSNMDQTAGMSAMDEKTLNSMLELIQNEIAKREAVGEPSMDMSAEHEGMEEVPSEAPVPDAPVGGTAPAAPVGDMKEAEMAADDIYFEMLNSFKNNIANCEDKGRKHMYKKCYEMCYKMREKFIKEMITPDEVAAPGTAPVK